MGVHTEFGAVIAVTGRYLLPMDVSRASFLRVALPGAAAFFGLRHGIAAAAPNPADFSGTYKYVGGKAQREPAVLRAI